MPKAKKRARAAKPKPPFPAQHQRRSGLESKMKPRPEFMAPGYKGSGKLDGRVALITGGDSGIGRAVANRHLSRPGQPEELGPSYVFFASNADSSYITGEVLTLLGGETTAG